MPGFHIKQDIMEYLTNAASCGCGQKQQQRNDLTGDTLVANISETYLGGTHAQRN